MEDSKGPGWSRARLAVVVFAVTVVSAAHVRVEAAGPDYRGFLLPLDRFYDVGCAVALIVLAWAIGLSIFRRTDFSPESAIERLLFATAIGIGIQGTSVLALGAISLLHPWALLMLGLLFIWTARDGLGRLREEVGRIGSELEGGAGRWILGTLGLVAVFLFLQSATPPADWDVLTYHLDIPREYLDAGRVHLPEDNHHAAFVGLQQMLYLPLLAAGAESAPAVISAVVALLLGLTMYAMGDRLFDGTTGTLAGVFLWGSPVVVLVAVTARVDVTMTWFLALAHLAVVASLERKSLDGWFWTAAVVAGLAVATKFSALLYIAALSPLVVWLVLTSSGRLRQRVGSLLICGTVTVAVAAPWLAKNFMLLGAPFYPYLAEIQLEPWLAEYLGTSSVPASMEPSAFRLSPDIREPFSLLALFTDPGSMTEEREGGLYFGNLVLMLLPLSLLWSRRKTLTLLVPPLVYLGLVLYPDARINLRYLVPALVMGTLVASHALNRAVRVVSSHASLRRAVWGATATVCLLPAAFAMYHKVEEMRPHEYWLGIVSERAYLRHNADPDVYLNSRVRDWVNEELPDGSRIVMLFESRGYGYRHDVIQDNLGTTWPVLAHHAPWRDCMRSTGATHILVNYGHLIGRVRRGLEIASVRWPAFGRFARTCLEREAAPVRNVVLYRIVRRSDG
jgi:hypothetical protein